MFTEKDRISKNGDVLYNSDTPWLQRLFKWLGIGPMTGLIIFFGGFFFTLMVLLVVIIRAFGG